MADDDNFELEIVKAQRDEYRRMLREFKHQVSTEIRNQALKAELGDVKPEYLQKLINYDDIKINRADGKVDPDSLKKAADQFRTQYPELLSEASVPVAQEHEPSASKGSSAVPMRELISARFPKKTSKSQTD